MFPIVGGRKIEHLHGNIEALDIKLTPAQIQTLEEVQPFDPGYPTFFCVSDNMLYCSASHIFIRVIPRTTLGESQPLAIQANGLSRPLLTLERVGEKIFVERVRVVVNSLNLGQVDKTLHRYKLKIIFIIFTTFFINQLSVMMTKY